MTRINPITRAYFMARCKIAIHVAKKHVRLHQRLIDLYMKISSEEGRKEVKYVLDECNKKVLHDMAVIEKHETVRASLRDGRIIDIEIVGDQWRITSRS